MKLEYITVDSIKSGMKEVAARFGAAERDGFLRARWRSVRVAIGSIFGGDAPADNATAGDAARA